MNAKELTKLVNYELVSLGTQHFVINGQEQTIEQKESKQQNNF